MKKTIGFIADTAADIPKDLQEKYDIKIIPLRVIFGDVTYNPCVDITNQEFYELIKTDPNHPTTSQSTPEDVENAYNEMLEKYDSIIHVTIGSEASGTFSVVSLVAQEFIEKGKDITVIDSHNLCVGIGVPVMNAAKMRDEGKSKEEIIEYIKTATTRDMPYFLVDDLNHLKKGGRIKASSVAIANLLDIKPILWVNQGLTQVMDKVRGSKKSVARLVDIMLEKGDNIKEQDVYVIHSLGGEKLDLCIKLIEEKIAPKSINVFELGPTIVTHCGLGVVCVYFIQKEA